MKIFQVRFYNKGLTLKAAELEGRIIYLEDELESERQFKEHQVKKFKTKEELLLAQVKKQHEDIKKQ